MTEMFSAKEVKKVKEAAIQAMLDANHEYIEWTENRVDRSRARAPELFYQVKVAERIRNLSFSPAVFLEYTAKDAVRRRPDRPLEILEGNKNIDILVAPKKDGGNFNPFQVALEIKRRAASWNVIERDVKRLTWLVNSEHYQMGLSLFLMRHPVGRRGETTFADQQRSLNEGMEDYRNKYSNIKFSLIAPRLGGELDMIMSSGAKQRRAWHVSGLVIRR